MPIDLVGIKGVFDGDESAIQFEDDAPPIHPKDRELLRPLNTLGKPMSATTGVSFLRRTEYISSMSSVNKADARNNALRRDGTVNRNKRRPDVNRDDPVTIARTIMKGFDIAYPQDAYKGQDTEHNIRSAEIAPEERNAWMRPKHPTNPSLTMLDSYPILPDLQAFPDTGNYMIIKFQNNPSTSDQYDPRLDVTLIRPLNANAEELAVYNEKLALHQADPSRPKPIPEYRYETYLPETPESVRNIKRKFSVLDPENDDDELYDHINTETERKAFRYKRLRTYETYQQSGNPDDPWNDNIAMVLHDPESDSHSGESMLQKAAYLYPVVQRTSLRAVRPKTMGYLARGRINDEEEDKVDFIELSIRDQTEDEREKLRSTREKWDPVSAQNGD